jgi:hypothetical protein
MIDAATKVPNTLTVPTAREARVSEATPACIQKVKKRKNVSSLLKLYLGMVLCEL